MGPARACMYPLACVVDGAGVISSVACSAKPREIEIGAVFVVTTAFFPRTFFEKKISHAWSTK